MHAPEHTDQGPDPSNVGCEDLLILRFTCSRSRARQPSIHLSKEGRPEKLQSEGISVLTSDHSMKVA